MYECHLHIFVGKIRYLINFTSTSIFLASGPLILRFYYSKPLNPGEERKRVCGWVGERADNEQMGIKEAKNETVMLLVWD